MGLGEENIGGGGMGPISVTPIGGSGRATWAPEGTAAAAEESAEMATAGAVCTVMPMTGDRLAGCDEAAVVETVGVVATADVPDDEVIVTTGITGNVAARAGGSLTATDGDAEPVKNKKNITIE